MCGVVQRCLESSGDVQSQPEMSRVSYTRVIWSRPEMAGVVRSCLKSSGDVRSRPEMSRVVRRCPESSRDFQRRPEIFGVQSHLESSRVAIVRSRSESAGVRAGEEIPDHKSIALALSRQLGPSRRFWMTPDNSKRLQTILNGFLSTVPITTAKPSYPNRAVRSKTLQESGSSDNQESSTRWASGRLKC